MHPMPITAPSSLELRNMIAGAAWCVLSFAAATSALAEPVSYRVDSQATHVEYAASALGVFTQRGQFTRVRGSVVLDRDAGRGEVEFTIDARSLATGWDVRDAFVQDEPLLDVARHRWIRFLSTHVVFADGRIARVDGDLTLRGVTRPVELNVTRFACGDAGDRCEADASATILRSAFGMERYAPLIDDHVELIFTIVVRRGSPAAETAESTPSRAGQP
jgi:polyisoprenoid-binding protein YceI